MKLEEILKTRTRAVAKTGVASPPESSGTTALLAELRAMIVTARERVAQAVNAGLVVLHWQIGQRIRKEILKEMRAD